MTVPRRVRAVTAFVAGVLVIGAAVSSAAAQESDPPYTVEEDRLEASLDCPEFVHPDREPVLLVHGTFTRGHEQWDWNWNQMLPERGFDVCIVTYPDRGLGDMQVSAEYVVHAIRTIHELTGRKVDVVGHSQGAILPRWAVTFWPSARAAVDDLVGLAGPHHGTSFGSFEGAENNPNGMPPVFWQFDAGSDFYAALNRGDETPGDIDWTQVYSQFDELVRPVEPEPTAALDFGEEGPSVANILIQDLCPGRFVDHLTIGTTDLLAVDLAVDALVNDGPADPARLELDPSCSIPDSYGSPNQLATFLAIFQDGLQNGAPNVRFVNEEPPLMPYARADQDAAGDDDAASRTVPDQEVGVPGLPTTGGGAGLLGLGLLGAAVRLRRR